MKYSIITFDDNIFFDARINNTDMVYIERYTGRNPLTIFTSVPPLGDLAFILYMSLRKSSSFTLDDIYDFIDDNDLTVERLTEIVIQLFKDMGYIDDNTKEKLDEKPDDIDKAPPQKSKQLEEKTFKQILESLLENYLLLGTSEEFWDANLEEVTTRFDRHKKLLRSTSESDYMLALMITSNIGTMLNGKGKKFARIEEFFPNLYDAEDDEAREERERKERIMRGFTEFASNFNKHKRLKEAESVGDKIEIE